MYKERQENDRKFRKLLFSHKEEEMLVKQMENEVDQMSKKPIECSTWDN